VSTGEREPIPTVAEAVTKAAAICDPDSEDAAVRGLIDSFEDDDRPVTVVEDLGGELSSVEQGIDPDEENPAAEMTVAAAIWLSRNPDQEHHHREHVLRESARLYCHGDPPLHVAEWLRELGIS
jgi:hypothetical protein